MCMTAQGLALGAAPPKGPVCAEFCRSVVVLTVVNVVVAGDPRVTPVMVMVKTADAMAVAISVKPPCCAEMLENAPDGAWLTIVGALPEPNRVDDTVATWLASSIVCVVNEAMTVLLCAVGILSAAVICRPMFWT